MELSPKSSYYRIDYHSGKVALCYLVAASRTEENSFNTFTSPLEAGPSLIQRDQPIFSQIVTALPVVMPSQLACEQKDALRSSEDHAVVGEASVR